MIDLGPHTFREHRVTNNLFETEFLKAQLKGGVTEESFNVVNIPLSAYLEQCHVRNIPEI